MLPIVLTALALMGVMPVPDSRVAWMSPAAQCEGLARTLQIAPGLHPIVVDTCRRSSTFRRQVVRLARQDGLEVTVSPGLFRADGRGPAPP